MVRITIYALLGCLSYSYGYPYEAVLSTAPSNLTVTTRTGTFIGNLNDTYPAVRQFKYIPYAKVQSPCLLLGFQCYSVVTV